MAGGRPKGSTNYHNHAIKDMLRVALNQVGGVDYLARQANENPVAFLGLIGRIIPQEVRADINGNQTITVNIMRFSEESLIDDITTIDNTTDDTATAILPSGIQGVSGQQTRSAEPIYEND